MFLIYTLDIPQIIEIQNKSNVFFEIEKSNQKSLISFQDYFETAISRKLKLEIHNNILY